MAEDILKKEQRIAEIMAEIKQVLTEGAKRDEHSKPEIARAGVRR